MESGMEIGDAVPQGRQAGATTSGIPARRNLMHPTLYYIFADGFNLQVKTPGQAPGKDH